MVDNNGGSRRRGPEKRTPPLANNLLWYLVALLLGTLLVVSLFNKSPIEIGYLDLWRLIEKGEPTNHADAYIDVTEEAGGVKRTIRYSDLSDSDLTIGRDEISGKVKRQVIKPENEQAEAEQ